MILPEYYKLSEMVVEGRTATTNDLPISIDIILLKSFCGALPLCLFHQTSLFKKMECPLHRVDPARRRCPVAISVLALGGIVCSTHGDARIVTGLDFLRCDSNHLSLSTNPLAE